MPIDPRFSAIISAIAGKQAGGMAQGNVPSAGQTMQAAVESAPDVMNNAGTMQAISGASAPAPAAAAAGNIEGMRIAAENPQFQNQSQTQSQSPGYGSTQAQPSQLGGASTQAPANMPTQAITVGSQTAQTPTEAGFWDTFVKNIAGRNPDGSPLGGADLGDFQKGHALGGFFGALGGAVGGDTTGGRLGTGVYKQAAGGLSAMNSEQQQQAANSFLQNALNTFANRPGYQNQVNAETGGTETIASLAGGSGGTVASLEDSLARMKSLSGI